MGYIYNDVKYLETNESMCRNVGACMRICAKTFHKTEDPTYSAIRIAQRSDGTMKIDVCNQCGTCIDVCPAKFGAVVKVSGEQLEVPAEPVPVAASKAAS